MVRVYHVKDSHAFSRDIPKPWQLTLVAKVDGTLEEAYHLTNHQEEAWNEVKDSRLEFLGKSEPRSTSVGDVMEMDGKFFQVAGIGYKEIPTMLL